MDKNKVGLDVVCKVYSLFMVWIEAGGLVGVMSMGHFFL